MQVLSYFSTQEVHTIVLRRLTTGEISKYTDLSTRDQKIQKNLKLKAYPAHLRGDTYC